MKLFLDTADVEEIKRYAAMGIVDGVTTNPSLLKKSGRDYKELVMEICEVVKGPVNVEGIANNADGIVKEAEEFAEWSPNIVVKISMSEEGIKAVHRLSEQGIRTNVTLIFNPLQALVAANAGADYVSPFMGRVDDVGGDGTDVIRKIADIYAMYGIDTEIVSASIRHPKHVLDSALAGADICTIPPSVMKKLISHPQTSEGIAKFEKDWAAWKQQRG